MVIIQTSLLKFLGNRTWETYSNPWNDATQMSTDCIEPIFLDGTILLHNQIGGVSLESLRQRMVTREVSFGPALKSDVISKSILGTLCPTSTTCPVNVQPYQNYYISRWRVGLPLLVLVFSNQEHPRIQWEKSSLWRRTTCPQCSEILVLQFPSLQNNSAHGIQ